jgi:hypothetical protein
MVGSNSIGATATQEQQAPGPGVSSVYNPGIHDSENTQFFAGASTAIAMVNQTAILAQPTVAADLTNSSSGIQSMGI